MSIKNENSPKAGGKQSLVALAKGILVEQQQRLHYKNNLELETLEDLYKFMKSRCQIEIHYNQQMVKLAAHYSQRKQVSLKTDPNSDEKALYPAWRGYLGQMERCSKEKLTHFEQMLSVVDQLKQMKTHKHQVVKKTMDTYFKKAQEDVIASLSEIDKCRKLYFDEEHYANQARDKDDKIKKRKLGILSKFTDMQSKKEKTSAQKEASEIQSTQARNEYILALCAGNAHLQHYFNTELTYLLDILEDNTIENCKEVLIKLIDKEEKCQSNSAAALKDCLEYLYKVTAAYTHLAFLTDGTNTSLSELLQIDFEPCEGDTNTEISIEHNAAFALEHEVTKWTTCFSKESRNLVKIDQQLIKCYKLQSAGKKTVEVNGIGQMDLDQRIEDLKLQKRKCDLNKCKAKARLLALNRGGLSIDDLDEIELQIANEFEEQLEKQQREKQMLAVNQGDNEALSRTASLRSTTVSPDLGRISVMENKSQSEDRQDFNDTPEPMSSENDLSEVDYAQQQKYNQQPAWNDYDANAQWGQEEQTVTSTAADTQNQYEEEYSANDQQINSDQQYAPQDLVNQYVQALYAYTAQNEDELDIVEYEQLLVVNADEKDWIKVQNSEEKTGYVPFAYVELISTDSNQQQINESNMQTATDGSQLADSQFSDSIIQSSPANQFYSEETTTSYTNQQYAYQEENYQDPTITQGSYQETTTTTASELVIDQDDKQDDKNYAIAAYDYEAENKEEISFKEGETIIILEKSDDGWWLGTNAQGQTGHFPSMLVHCDDEEEDEEIDEDENDEEENSQESIEELKFQPPPSLPPPPTLPPAPVLLPNPIVITQPTPDVEHKPIVEEENSTDKIDQNEIKEEKEEDIGEKPIRQNYVQTTVEINVIESEKQVYSSDEEEDAINKESVENKTEVDKSKDELENESTKEIKDESTELPLPDEEIKVQVSNETVGINLDDLPPPPAELTDAFSPDENNEDEQLILKRLKQLKDTNNNFTASFDILDDSELTTAENSQSIEDKENESKPETESENQLNKDQLEDKDQFESKDQIDNQNTSDQNNKTQNDKVQDDKTQDKNESKDKDENKNDKKEPSFDNTHSDSGFANFEANFETNFEANFQEDEEDLK